jgi:tRNA nucleotidyltransferase (CCA-adding enzyme)
MLRGLRLVSQLGFDLADGTLDQMSSEAGGLEHVSGERIGGGLSADGMGELSLLLLGGEPARALRIARDTGVLVAFLPEYGPAIGYRLETERQPAPLDEHLFRVVQEAADDGASLATRLAALLHDLGKPETDASGGRHAEAGARIAATVLRRLRYPTRLRQLTVAIVRAHSFHTDGPVTGARARRFLAEHGDELALDLLAHKLADLETKRVPAEELDRALRLRDAVLEERGSPHRIGDLAVDGSDLIELGFSEGPEIGHVLRVLLDEVLDDPGANERDTLLTRAAREKP